MTKAQRAGGGHRGQGEETEGKGSTEECGRGQRGQEEEGTEGRERRVQRARGRRTLRARGGQRRQGEVMVTVERRGNTPCLVQPRPPPTHTHCPHGIAISATN